MNYPYVDNQTVWDHQIKFQITKLNEDWYKTSWINGAGGDRELGFHNRNNWNPKLRQMIAPGNVVFDVGAHHGWTTTVFATHVGSSGSVVAFEAVQYNCEVLQKNMELNQLKNVILVNKVVSNIAGKDHYFLAERVQKPGTGVPIQSICLDDYIQHKPNVMKIDVEGYEFHVLEGALKLLNTFHPRLEIEMHLSVNGGVNMKDYGTTPEGIYQLLKDCGYHTFESIMGGIGGQQQFLLATP
jgi:FkbM family methyltransferase